MPNVLIVKNEQGKLEGFGERGAKAYNRFRADVQALEVGELLAFSYRVPRSGKFHNRHFLMLEAVYDAQEKFTNEYHFRKWGELGAGHCDWIPGQNGVLTPIPKSIDYESLDDLEFQPVHYAIKAFLRSEHATGILWPHLSREQQWEMIEQLLMGFD